MLVEVADSGMCGMQLAGQAGAVGEQQTGSERRELLVLSAGDSCVRKHTPLIVLWTHNTTICRGGCAQGAAAAAQSFAASGGICSGRTVT